MPAYPPVTIAVLPSSLRSQITSRAVVCALNPDGIGCCAGMEILSAVGDSPPQRRRALPGAERARERVGLGKAEQERDIDRLEVGVLEQRRDATWRTSSS